MVDRFAQDPDDGPVSGAEPSPPATDHPRVAIVEDHLLQRRRTEELLDSRGGARIVCSCESLPDFVHWLQSVDGPDRPHLLVLDLGVDRGPSADPAIVQEVVNSGIRVLVLSALASIPLVRAVIRAGASGIVGKRDREDDVLDAVRTVLDDGEWMTPELAGIIAGDQTRPRLSDQEERALVLYASGLTLSAVASALGVKPATAKQYLERIKTKYTTAGRPLHTKTDIVRVAISDGYVDPPDRDGSHSGV